MNEIFEWVGTVCGITGAALIASNVRLSPWGWWLFLVSSLSLCGFGLSIGAYGILLLNLCFVLTNITGLYRVWLPYMRNRKFSVPADKHQGEGTILNSQG
jgi:nicotinamide riboside transporter PnuC